MTRKVNAETVRLIKQWEGFRAEAYLCTGNKWTIGYGHTATARGYRDRGERITLERAEILLIQDLAWAEAAITRLVRVRLTDNQFGALVAWVFNIGETEARTSTLIRKLNAGDYDAVPAELVKWNRSSGRVTAGLVNRRAAEVGLWARGSHVAGREVVADSAEPTSLLAAVQTNTGIGASFPTFAAMASSVLAAMQGLDWRIVMVMVFASLLAYFGTLWWRSRKA
jgi:lysozyme